MVIGRVTPFGAPTEHTTETSLALIATDGLLSGNDAQLITWCPGSPSVRRDRLDRVDQHRLLVQQDRRLPVVLAVPEAQPDLADQADPG